MHGLINKSVQTFLRKQYDPALWDDVAAEIGVGPEGFEAMLHYDDADTEALLTAASRRLDRPREALLEDIGTFLVTIEPLRRLLRFGGGDYRDFLYSLDELQGRGLMALPDLELPELTLTEKHGGRFGLEVVGPFAGWGAVLAGLLRAMADDYGALALIEPAEPGPMGERLQVTLLDTRYAQGRSFELAQPMEDA